MKNFKQLLFFIIKFIFTYLFFTLLYKIYLDIFKNRLDPYSILIVKISNVIMKIVGYQVDISEKYAKYSYLIYIDNKPTSLFNEGCNGLSLIIIFISFILSLNRFIQIKKNIIFLINSIFSIFIINIFRVTYLNFILRYFKHYGIYFHEYIMPSIMYGLIIILWIFWIKITIKNETKSN